MEKTTYNFQARELRSVFENHRARFKSILLLAVLSPGGTDKGVTPPPLLKRFQNWNLIKNLFLSTIYRIRVERILFLPCLKKKKYPGKIRHFNFRTNDGSAVEEGNGPPWPHLSLPSTRLLPVYSTTHLVDSGGGRKEGGRAGGDPDAPGGAAEGLFLQPATNPRLSSPGKEHRETGERGAQSGLGPSVS